jgi:ubiquinone biosynthesis protein
MKWIQRGWQLGLAYKNAGRLKEIIAVFARHGFTDFAMRMNLERLMPAKWKTVLSEQREVPTEVRLRIAFEELGPAFIKLGQLLASRPDLVPDSFVEEFLKLQDNVSADSFDKIRLTVEADLGMSIEKAYREFDPQPLATASIAQVHGAILHTGEKVVVKIQRDGIARIVNQDVALLEFLAKLLEKYIPESRIVSPTTVVEEFFRVLQQELDFSIEANNIAKISQNLKSFTDIKIPKVYRELSSHRVLTLERLEGIPLKNLDLAKKAGHNLKKLNEIGARAFFKSVMLDGLFHGDPHGGNLFVLSDGRLGIVDFGMVGRLSAKSRQNFSNMVLAILSEDFETLCYCYADLGSADTSVDFDGFQREVRNTLAPYLGMRAQDVNSGRVLIEATKIAAKYQIRVPGDWMMVFRALFTMEGLGRALDPDFDIMDLGKDLVKDIVKEQFSPEKMGKDLLWIAKDTMSLAQVLPRNIRWAIRKWAKDGYAFEVQSPQVEQLRLQLERNSKRSSSSLISAGLFVASAISLNAQDTDRIWNYPVFTVVTFVLAGYFWWKS